MADKTTIIEIQYDTQAAIDNLIKLTDAVVANEKQQESLKKAYKDGTITQEQYSQSLLESKEETAKLNAQRKDTVKGLQSEEGSINKLRAEVSRLTKERNSLNLNTAEGQKRIKEINKTLDQHGKILKDNVDVYAKQKLNIGNYPELMGQAGGAIGGVTNGIMGMTKAAMAFIATPLGLIIGAIALALKALMSYFKGSEEGQNALNKETKVFGVILGNIGDKVQEVGKQIFEMATKPKEAIEKLGETIKERLINRFEAFGKIGKAIVKIFSSEWKQGIIDLGNASGQLMTGIEDPITRLKDAITGVIDESAKEMKIAANIADREAALIKLKRNWMIEEAKLQREIAENKLKAANQELSKEERVKALEAALGAEEKILQTNIKIANEKAKLKTLQNSLSNSTIEDLNEEAQLKADAIRVETDSFNKRKEMASMLSGLKKELNKTEEVEDDKTIERRAKALADLSELKTQQAINEQTDLAKKRELEIAYEDEKVRKAKEDATVLSEELLVIEERAAQKKKAIDKDYNAQLKTNKQKRMNDALDIAAQASQLSSLISINHQNEFASFEKQKNDELKKWEGNAEMQRQVSERYAAEEAKLKTKQAKQNKAQALIDATMATALAVVSALSMKPFMPMGLISASIAGVMGAASIGVIASQKVPTFAKGGMIGGRSHAQGGTKFWGSDGSMFEAERGEAMFVLKKDASAEISALSMLNQAHGGRSFTQSSNHLAEGGQAQGANVERIVDDAIQRTPIFVEIGSIETGLTDYRKVKQAGVL